MLAGRNAGIGRADPLGSSGIILPASCDSHIDSHLGEWQRTGAHRSEWNLTDLLAKRTRADKGEQPDYD